MTRLEKIIAHLKAKGAQYIGDAGDKIVSDKFTEHVFRNLSPSVRVREYSHGLLEVLFVSHEICAGMSRDAFHKMPPMDDVLQWIDNDTQSIPQERTSA
jgi:hypothetical protein